MPRLFSRHFRSLSAVILAASAVVRAADQTGHSGAAITHTIASLEELRLLVGQDGVAVTMKPGVYHIRPGAPSTTVQLPVRNRAGEIVEKAETPAARAGFPKCPGACFGVVY
jgi:hypothetical protein